MDVFIAKSNIAYDVVFVYQIGQTVIGILWWKILGSQILTESSYVLGVGWEIASNIYGT